MSRVVLDNPKFAKARKLRETFVDRPAEHAQMMPWEWPDTMLHVGRCEAVMYASDKWQQRRGDDKLYKHVAEGAQELCVREGFLRLAEDPRTELEIAPRVVKLAHMPESFAVLAKALGFQCRLFDRPGHLGPDETHLFQVDVTRAWLGSALHPAYGTILFVYDSTGPLALMSGPSLTITKDGIAG